MRIIDWSSDVCSSDLPAADADLLGELPFGRQLPPPFLLALVDDAAQALQSQAGVAPDRLLFARPGFPVLKRRSDARCLGTGCVRSCSSRWSPYHLKNTLNTTQHRKGSTHHTLH